MLPVDLPLALQPHHDGSPLHLDDEAPARGTTVEVRVRVPHGAPYDDLWLRSTPDGEPDLVPLRPCPAPAGAPGDPRDRWYAAALAVVNPVQRYRFLLAGDGGERQHWLTGAGVVAGDVPDALDFVVSSHGTAPAWGRDAVVYQVFPDRFARSAAADARPVPAWARPATAWDEDPVATGPDVPLHFFGGDLDGLREHLDHVAAVGADVLYTTPLFPGESNHRYNASTFDRVDPLLGGDEALVALVEAVHARGWRFLGDLTTNHTGDTHEWFRRAVADPTSAERGFYLVGEDGSYACWKGYRTLPKLDHRDPELGRRLHEVVRRWLEPPYAFDGWRIDVANMTGRHGEVDLARDVARALRRTVTDVRPDALLLAEHGHDASGDLDGDGWHGTMDYYGFSLPVWSFLRDPDGPVPSFGMPLGTPRRTGGEALASMRAFTARFGWRAVGTSWNILSSHDTPRIRTITGGAERHHVAVGCQFALPGVPMVYAGDEVGLEGVDGEAGRRTMPWGPDGTVPPGATLEAYASAAALRRAHPALRGGGLRWLLAGDDAWVWSREHPEGSLLCLAARDATAVDLPLPPGELLLALGPVRTGTASGRHRAATSGPAFAAWRLD